MAVPSSKVAVTFIVSLVPIKPLSVLDEPMLSAIVRPEMAT